MADAFRRAAADPLRPARVFEPAFALGAVVFLVAAVVIGLSALTAERTVIASSDGASLTLPEGAGAGSLVVYAALADGTRPPAPRDCTLDTTGSARARYTIRDGRISVDGRTLRRSAEVTQGWLPGDVLTCPGVAAIATTTGGGPLLRLALAGMLLFGAAISAVLALVGRSSRRARTTDGH